MTETRPFKIHVPQICYGGSMTADFHLSTLATLSERDLLKGRTVHSYMIPWESLIPRARNYAASALLADPEGDALLFIDSDIQFQPSDVRALLDHMDRVGPCVVGGAYPKKWHNPAKVAHMWQRFEEPPGNQEELITDFSSEIDYRFVDWEVPGEVARVKNMATGFMLIHRKVLQDLADEGAKPYDNDISGYNDVEQFWDFFPTGPLERKYLSEDYGFCHLVRTFTGHPIHLLTRLTLGHVGRRVFYGNLQNQIDFYGAPENAPAKT